MIWYACSLVVLVRTRPSKITVHKILVVSAASFPLVPGRGNDQLGNTETNELGRLFVSRQSIVQLILVTTGIINNYIHSSTEHSSQTNCTFHIPWTNHTSGDTTFHATGAYHILFGDSELQWWQWLSNCNKFCFPSNSGNPDRSHQYCIHHIWERGCYT